MEDARVTLECARDLVLAAIERIKVAKQEHLNAQANPRSSTIAREMARGRYDEVRAQFGWQWENVERLLTEPMEERRI